MYKIPEVFLLKGIPTQYTVVKKIRRTKKR